jgi:hypothetical protein
MFDKLRKQFKTNMAATVDKCKTTKKLKGCVNCGEFGLCYIKKYEAK